MQSWGSQREIEKPKKTQQFRVSELPEPKQDRAMADTERASEEYPRTDIVDGYGIHVDGYGIHVCEIGGEWQVWLNTEVADFDGICLGAGATRHDAVRDAVKVIEAMHNLLQGPPSGYGFRDV